MQGKILGIPLVLIILVISIVLLIDVPMSVMNGTTQKQLTVLQMEQTNTSLTVRRLMVTPTLVATPSATPSPTTVLRTFRQPVTSPTLK